MQREALPQLSTSPPDWLKMRIRTSARSDRSITISWSQPIPRLRSAMARTSASVSESGRTRASKTTKSLPSPFILRKGMPSSRDMAAYMAKCRAKNQPERRFRPGLVDFPPAKA